MAMHTILLPATRNLCLVTSGIQRRLDFLDFKHGTTTDATAERVGVCADVEYNATRDGSHSSKGLYVTIATFNWHRDVKQDGYIAAINLREYRIYHGNKANDGYSSEI